MSVAFLPTIMVSIPLTVIFIFTLNIVLRQFGAADLSGAGAAIGAVTQLGPLTTVLVVAGAGSTAICADLGARTIHEEIDAMEVLGIDPIHRLVVPRVLAATVVATLLNGLVITVGLGGGYIFGVYLQNVSGGAYLATLTTIAGLPEVVIAMVKAAVFGLIAGLVGCYRGLTVRGSKGLGTAVNETVVQCDRTVRGQRGGNHDRRAVRDGTLTCSTAAVLRTRFPYAAANFNRYAGGALPGMDQAGQLAWFAVTTVGQIPHALRYYRKETLRLIAQIGMGTGAMAVIGGTVAIVGFVTLSGSSIVAIQAFASLGNIGVDTFTGFFTALLNVRAAAPVISGIALAATVGAGATAELGAMRISEEIDALEVMGIKSIAYLASTRFIAGVIVMIPLYAMAIIMSFLSPQVVTTPLYGQSNGTYEHYFRTFLRPDDVFWSFAEAIVVTAIVMITHCYYGYIASGGPVGVGESVGRSMRFSLISVQVVVMLALAALYGVNPNFNRTV